MRDTIILNCIIIIIIKQNKKFILILKFLFKFNLKSNKKKREKKVEF